MKFIFLVVSSKTHIHEGEIHIDRVDLTRKLDAINTWVQDVIHTEHEVIFFDGDNEYEWYDEKNITLHLVESDKYEVDDVSNLFPKVKSALRWVLNNRQFDYVYLCDDDIYINLEQFLKIKVSHDFMGTGSMGGGGFFFNEKSINTILNYENKNFRVCDQAIYNAIINDQSITKIFENFKSSIYYFPGELYGTIHYVAGKRSYFLHNIFRYFNENGYTNRKIIIGFPIDVRIHNEIVSYESTYGRKTRRWYDFTTDPNGWEYHGGYLRSNINIHHLKTFWPYAENSTKFFVLNFNVLLNDYIGHKDFNEHLEYLINQCEKSLINKNNLLLCTQEICEIQGWVLDNTVKEKYKLNFELLNDYNFYKKIN